MAALNKVCLRKTETLEVWKIWGPAASTAATIALATDMLSPTMVISGTPTVNIIAATWAVSNGAGPDVVSVSRGADTILTLYQNGQMDFGGNGGFSDTVGNTADIVVNITGTGQLYLTLRKVAGYKSKVQPETYGPYDNTALTTA